MGRVILRDEGESMRAVKEYGIAERERAGGLACSARRDDPARISDVAHASRPSCDFEPGRQVRLAVTCIA
jgi:hypothetical protein